MRFCAGLLPIWPGTSTQNDLPAGHGSCRRRCPRGGDLQGVEVQQARLLPVEGQPGDGTGLGDAHLVNAARDIHADDPAFGYRFIADELPEKGITAGENRVQRLCTGPRHLVGVLKKRGLNRKPGPPVHDDLVERDFTAAAPNELWLTDITEHPTAEGKLYLCAVKDVYSGRIVGYSMDSRMKSSLAVAALENAVRHAARQERWCTRTAAPSSGPAASSNRSGTTGSQGRWAGSVRARTTPRWNPSSRCCRRTSWTASDGSPGRNSGWRSRPGSKGPTTAGDGKDGWENSRPSNMKQSTGPRSQRPKTPSQQKPGQSRTCSESGRPVASTPGRPDINAHNITVIMLWIDCALSGEEAASSLAGLCTTIRRYGNLRRQGFAGGCRGRMGPDPASLTSPYTPGLGPKRPPCAMAERHARVRP